MPADSSLMMRARLKIMLRVLLDYFCVPLTRQAMSSSGGLSNSSQIAIRGPIGHEPSRILP
jgi:hypothetical protein